jgi:inosine/xanthosine triphosphate pyrophosphatase family protein
MKLIIGTRNQAKIDQVKSALKGWEIDIDGLPNNINFPPITEDGPTAVANARKKALTYAKLIGQPVFSMDNTLYFEGLSNDHQPGLNVRRIGSGSARLSDLEAVEYYAKIIKSVGDRIVGYWEYGLCLARPDGQTKETTFRSPRTFVSEPSPKVIAGYPLESLQIDPGTGKYSSEVTAEERDKFYQGSETTGQKLRDFIASLPKYYLN